MEQIVQMIVRQLKPGQRTMIGIAGHGGAGKTTLAARLRDVIGDVNVIHTDPYIVDSAIRQHVSLTYEAEGETHHDKMTTCHPAAHHTRALERDLQMVRAGHGFFTLDVPYLEQTWIDPSRDVTIVEGMSVTFVDPKWFDQSVYLYTTSETEFARRATRDVSERGMTLSYLKASHRQRRLQYECFMHPYRTRYPLVVETSDEAWVVQR